MMFALQKCVFRALSKRHEKKPLLECERSGNLQNPNTQFENHSEKSL